jgi:3'-phosphoadenosine 5'-phosphosulfate sulfotransferase (PAPS reductase)/FAD synthetase
MKYFVSCSFGKDSIATVLLALLHNEPLDGAVFAEVMFDNERGISGEVPEHIDWIKNVAKPKLEAMGCPVYIVKNTDTDYVH